MNEETTRYMEHRIHVARQAAYNIKINSDELQLFAIQPSDKVAAKNKALEATMRIRRLACAIMGMSDRRINEQIAVDPELLLDLMQAVIDGKTEGIRDIELEKIVMKASEMVLAVYRDNPMTDETSDDVEKQEQEAA